MDFSKYNNDEAIAEARNILEEAIEAMGYELSQVEGGIFGSIDECIKNLLKETME